MWLRWNPYLFGLVVFELVFVNNGKLEINIRGLFELGVHLENSSKSFFCVVVRLEFFIEYSDTIPQVGVLLKSGFKESYRELSFYPQSVKL